MNKESRPFDQEKDFNRAMSELEELRREGRNVASVEKDIWQKRQKQINDFHSEKNKAPSVFEENNQGKIK